MKSAIPILLFVLLISQTYGAGLNPVSPSNGATIDPSKNEFSFATMSDDIVEQCQLLIDGVALKNVSYRDSIRSRTINYAVAVSDGAHNWQVRCHTNMGTLDTPIRNFTAVTAEGSNIKVVPSGVFRGSFLHIFTFDIAGSPVTVTKLAPGDFIDVKLTPSGFEKEYYVKQLTSKNDKRYLVVEDSSSRVNYNLYEGENTTLNISSARIPVAFTGTTQNKATLVFYPTSSEQSVTIPTVEEQEPELNETTETPTIPVAEEPIAEPAPVVENRPLVNNTKPIASPQRQSGVKRFLSWMSNIFG